MLIICCRESRAKLFLEIKEYEEKGNQYSEKSAPMPSFIKEQLTQSQSSPNNDNELKNQKYGEAEGNNDFNFSEAISLD